MEAAWANEVPRAEGVVPFPLQEAWRDLLGEELCKRLDGTQRLRLHAVGGSLVWLVQNVGSGSAMLERVRAAAAQLGGALRVRWAPPAAGSMGVGEALGRLVGAVESAAADLSLSRARAPLVVEEEYGGEEEEEYGTGGCQAAPRRSGYTALEVERLCGDENYDERVEDAAAEAEAEEERAFAAWESAFGDPSDPRDGSDGLGPYREACTAAEEEGEDDY